MMELVTEVLADLSGTDGKETVELGEVFRRLRDAQMNATDAQVNDAATQIIEGLAAAGFHFVEYQDGADQVAGLWLSEHAAHWAMDAWQQFGREPGVGDVGMFVRDATAHQPAHNDLVHLVTAEIVEELKEDDVELWRVVRALNDRAPLLSVEDKERAVRDIVGALLDGDVSFGSTYPPLDDPPFVPWPKDEVADRIVREWRALGTDPSIGDVGWFT